MKLRAALNLIQDFANEPDFYNPCVPLNHCHTGA
jgi:hypothetical protein